MNTSTPSGKLVALQPVQGLYDDAIRVEWYFGLLCNFACSYCAEWKREPNAPTELLMKAADLLALRIRESGRRGIVLLSGGEPTVHPDIEKLVSKLGSLDFETRMISNGAKDPELYLRMLEHVKDYTFSLHFEFEYKKTLQTIESVWSHIKENKIKRYLFIHVMMVPGYFDEAKQAIAWLQKEGIPFILRRCRPLTDKEGRFVPTRRMREEKRRPDEYYTHEELSYLESWVYKMKPNIEEFWREADGNVTKRIGNANGISIREINKFDGWKCWIGIERLFVYPDGGVFRNSCKVGGTLGNVYSDFQLPNVPVTCTKKRCTDAWSINVSKHDPHQGERVLRVGDGPSTA